MSTPTVTITLTLPELDLVRDHFIHQAMTRDIDYTPDLPVYLSAAAKLTEALRSQGIEPRYGRSL